MRILSIDDHPVYLNALKMIVEDHFDPVEFVGLPSLEDAFDLAGTIAEFNLVIADLSFRGKDITRRVCALIQNSPDAKFLVLTNFEDERHVHAAWEAGARGYLPKSAPAEILTSVVQLVAAGGRYFPNEPSNDPNQGSAHTTNGADKSEALLSPRQKDIFEKLAGGASISELADRLAVSEPTIKADISKATRALDGRNRLHAVCRALEIGLIDPELG